MIRKNTYDSLLLISEYPDGIKPGVFAIKRWGDDDTKSEMFRMAAVNSCNMEMYKYTVRYLERLRMRGLVSREPGDRYILTDEGKKCLEDKKNTNKVSK